jgi:hypothetical protein
VATKRITLKDRRDNDKQGLDILIPSAPTENTFEPSKSDESKFVKATFYIRLDQVTTLEEIQLINRKETGVKTDKSELIRNAIDLLAGNHRIE